MSTNKLMMLLIIGLALSTLCGCLQTSTLTLEAYAQPLTPGIGLSGSFYTLNGLSIPQGGFIKSYDVFIVVYSYYDKPLEVILNTSAPQGINVSFYPNETEFILQPGESKRFNVIINVSDNIVPGQYKVTVYAEAVYKPQSGPIVILPSVAQDIDLVITGAYAIIHAAAVDPYGRVVESALLRLYQPLKGKLVSIVDSYGELTARVIPGNYTIRVYLAGDLVGEESVTVQEGDEVFLTIPIRVLFIEYFAVKPVVASDGRLVAARITLNVKNVYKTITDASIVLVVQKDGTLLERRTIIESSILPEGRSSYTLDYVPPEGWSPGNYTFKVEIYGFGGKLLAESDTKWLYYEQPRAGPSPYWILLVVPPALAIILVIATARRRRRKTRRNKRNNAPKSRRI